MLLNQIDIHNGFRSFRISFIEHEGAVYMKCQDLKSNQIFACRKIVWDLLEEGKTYRHATSIIPDLGAKLRAALEMQKALNAIDPSERKDRP